MKGPSYLLVLLLVSLVALVVADEKYTRKYDDVNVDKILQNNRVLTNYIRCLMDEGPCTAEGRELRKTLPDALSNGCDKCNDKQKVMAEKVINHLKAKRSRDWDRLVAKYDPRGEYKKRYEKS
ncbi:ejaculatory bulb-specific protein 3-like [Temnothorax longispinosus]|uniref:Ejaculatory bulb-specific protein 3 n=1 Tax=Temnothorax longispinosus TaxID=300112 RepID=A0A4S2KXP7_9HYME|nr:Ejaculatory bulb-specific protein 3 [Temnothorax longispinosus]